MWEVLNDNRSIDNEEVEIWVGAYFWGRIVSVVLNMFILRVLWKIQGIVCILQRLFRLQQLYYIHSFVCVCVVLCGSFTYVPFITTTAWDGDTQGHYHQKAFLCYPSGVIPISPRFPTSWPLVITNQLLPLWFQEYCINVIMEYVSFEICLYLA